MRRQRQIAGYAGESKPEAVRCRPCPPEQRAWQAARHASGQAAQELACKRGLVDYGQDKPSSDLGGILPEDWAPVINPFERLEYDQLDQVRNELCTNGMIAAHSGYMNYVQQLQSPLSLIDEAINKQAH